MPNTKTVYKNHTTGKALHLTAYDPTTGNLLDAVDGVWKATPTTPFHDLTEDVTQKGLYIWSENRQVWGDGKKLFTVRENTSGGANAWTDEIVGEGEMWIKTDSEAVVDVSLSSLAGAGFSEAMMSLEALKGRFDTQDIDITAIKAKTDTISWGDVSFLLDCIKNRKYLKKVGSTWYLIIRNAADTADVINKALKDKDGNEITDIVAGALNEELASSV